MKAEAVVFVVDDDDPATEVIRRLASMMDFECRVFSSGYEFLATYDGCQAGCLVTEVRSPGVNGLQIQQRLAAQGATLPVIFVARAATVPLAVRAMRAGAFHFLEKPVHEQEMWDAIQDAVALDRQRHLVRQEREEVRRRLVGLTPKETQVLRMIGEAKSNRAIARELDLSIRTIEVRRSTLMRKLGFETPDELVRFAVHAFHRDLGANGDHPALHRVAPGDGAFPPMHFPGLAERRRPR